MQQSSFWKHRVNSGDLLEATQWNGTVAVMSGNFLPEFIQADMTTGLEYLQYSGVVYTFTLQLFAEVLM